MLHWTSMKLPFVFVLSQALLSMGIDVKRSFFVLDEKEHGYSLASTSLLDKDVFECTKETECEFVSKKAVDSTRPMSTWFKNIYALPEYVGLSRTRDCLDLKREGETRTGIYLMLLLGKVKQIPCDMTTDGGGWTVFQRRVDSSVNFNRVWNNYKAGFGDPKQNFWLGLDLIHNMISVSDSELRVELVHYQDGKLYAQYAHANIGNETQNYLFTVSGYSGTAGDALRLHNNLQFTTTDRDNDRRSSNCADTYKGGFWFASCFSAHPNGLYPSKNETGASYMSWFPFKKHYGGIIFTEMKFRRRVQ